jgi:hypothetical protein
MTPQEFKAWFDGFSEGIDGLPSEKQWEKIKRRVKDIDNKPVTYTVYRDIYLPPYRLQDPYYRNSVTWCSGSMTAAAHVPADKNQMIMNESSDFNSLTAMYDLGKLES